MVNFILNSDAKYSSINIIALDNYESLSITEKDVICVISLNDQSMYHFNRDNLIKLVTTRAKKSLLFFGYFNESKVSY